MTQPDGLQYASPNDAPKTSGLAIAGMILGIASIPFGCVVPFLLAITAIVLSAVALGQIKKDEKLTGRGFAITGLVTGIVGLVVIVPLLLSILLPSLNRARETANKVKCASNLRQVGLASILYADAERDGTLPPSPQAMLETQDITTAVFTCPSTGHTAANAVGPLTLGQDLSYVWIGDDLTNYAGANDALALEPLSNHNGEGSNMLWGDGAVTFELAADVRAEVAALLAAGRMTQAEADAVLDVGP